MNFTVALTRQPPARALALVLLALLPACAPRDPAPVALDLASSWSVVVHPEPWLLSGFAYDLDLSGIASADGVHCLVGSDESFHVQPGVIDTAARHIVAASPIPLPLAVPAGKSEIDIEGVAWCDITRSYYATGSHGVGKKKADYQPNRHTVVQVPVDPRTGEIVEQEIRSTSLLPWIERTPVLAPALRRPLQQNGLNIEGLACTGGRLSFGLRAPNDSGRAFIIDVAVGDLFDGEPRALTVHEVAVANGRGIRELVAVQGGFVVLTGNASAEASKRFPATDAPEPDVRFELFFWDGAAATLVPIGALPTTGGKAEALLALAETPAHVDLLVLFDGLPGGGALEVRLSRIEPAPSAASAVPPGRSASS